MTSKISKFLVLSVASLFIAALTTPLSSVSFAEPTAASQAHAAPRVSTQQNASPLITMNASLFLAVVTYDPGGFEASMVAVEDVNGDGKPDLVVANCGDCYTVVDAGSVGVMLGNGDGTFQAAVAYAPGGVTPRFVAVADVNGDGKTDLVVANRCGNNGCLNEAVVGVLLGNGDGTFQAALSYGSGGLFTSSVAVADVNSDGKLDLLVANDCADSNCDGSVSVLLGNGDGTFQAAVPYSSGGLEAFALAVGDVNGDGKPDVLVTTNILICTGGACGTVGVLLGNGDGTFQAAVTYGSGGILLRGSLAVADVNGDSKPDIVVENSQCCGSGNGVTGVLLGNGDGTFQTVVTYGSGEGGWGTSIAVADTNGDGKADLVVTDQCAAGDCLNEGLVGVLLGNGDGTFQAAVTFSTGGFLTNWVAVADVNGDGATDLVVANQCADNSFLCRQTSVGVLLNNITMDVTPPVVTLSAAPKSLPPNGKLVPVTVSGSITDSGSGLLASGAEYAVTDEYHLVQPRGQITLDGKGNYSFTILLSASRNSDDKDGRQYIIRVSAYDKAGNRGAKWQVVRVTYER